MIKRLLNVLYKKKLKKILRMEMVNTYIELNRLIKNTDYNSIIVGSSHGEYGIKSELLSDDNNKYLNCATISQDLYRSYELIKNISQTKEIKKIIMTYSLFSNGFVLEKIKTENKFCYLSDLFLNIKTRFSYTDEDNYNLKIIKKYAKTYPSKNKHRNAFGDKIDTFYFINYMNVEERVSGHIKHNKRDNNEREYVEKIINYCKENNIELLLVVMPVREDYAEEVAKFDDYKSFYKNIIDLTTKTNIPLLLYDNNLMEYNDFGDYDHLTEQGALKFSKILKQDIKNL